jgi:transposase-like protein
MSPFPTISELGNLFADDASCTKYLLDKGVFYTSLPCPFCSKPMSRNLERMTFRCNRNCGRREMSIRKHTFFYGSMLSNMDIMRLGHLWLSGVSTTSAILLTGHSSKTVTTFYNHFRVLVSSSLSEEDQIIGGDGVIVEIDETKLGKHKYQRDHRVEGVWVVTGIERTELARIFAVPVENRSAETLNEVIMKHVVPGSIIYTDLWKGYNELKENLGFSHFTVNHSKHFKDPDTFVCTNKVEGFNNGLKMKIPARNRVKDGMGERLSEYIWRKKNSDNLWNDFISAMVDVHYDLE